MSPSRVRIPPSPFTAYHARPRRGGRAVECGGLENRYPSLGGSRVQIPPPPPQSPAARVGRPERCPSGLRSATGNRVRAERCVAGSNPALSALATGLRAGRVRSGDRDVHDAGMRLALLAAAALVAVGAARAG